MERKYDIAISFSGQDRALAESIALILAEKSVRIFYDEFEKADLWGKNLYEHFISIYSEQSKYVLMIISESYAESVWTTLERKAMQSRVLKENQEYILALRLDDTAIPGILDTLGYIDYKNETPESVSELVLRKLWGNVKSDIGAKNLKPQLELVYTGLMCACEYLFRMQDGLRVHDIRLLPEILITAEKRINQLGQKIHININVTDKLVAAQLQKLLECAIDIYRRLHFLSKINLFVSKKYLFVCEIPNENISDIHDFLDRLGAFDEYEKNNKRHYLPSEIVDYWSNFSKDVKNYDKDPENCRNTSKLYPYLFDQDTARKLGGDFKAERIKIFHLA